jgi:poly(3-hydroxybutyrate) depolymerase
MLRNTSPPFFKEGMPNTAGVVDSRLSLARMRDLYFEEKFLLMKTLKHTLLALLLFVSCNIAAQSMSNAEWLKTITSNAVTKPGQPVRPGHALYFTQVGDMQVPYIVYVSEKYDPAKPSPVVIFLHGAILAKEDFQYKDPEIADEPIFRVGDSFNAIIVFPFSKGGFAWPAQSAACENVFTILAQVKEMYNVDSKKIFLGGISMGGAGTYWFISNKPEMFAGFYTFSAHPGNIKNFTRITKDKPLYAVYAEDDPSISYPDVKSIWELHKTEAPGFHINSVTKGGHRFIYRVGGPRITTYILGKLLKP